MDAGRTDVDAGRTDWIRDSPREYGLDPGIHCVRTRRIQGFMALRLVRRTRSVMLMVPVCPSPVFSGRRPGPAHSLRGVEQFQRHEHGFPAPTLAN